MRIQIYHHTNYTQMFSIECQYLYLFLKVESYKPPSVSPNEVTTFLDRIRSVPNLSQQNHKGTTKDG